jgi:uncharacterized protein YqeY
MIDQLRAELLGARKRRDAVAVAALRSALAAIANAEAVPPSAHPVASSEHVAGAATGLGAAEVPRRVLTPEDVAAILQNEVAERRHAATDYAALGRDAEAQRLRDEAAVLAGYLG